MARQAWQSVDIATVNGNTVRLRTMRNSTARWHTHVDSDELFYVLSGLFHLDTDERSVDLRPGEIFVVPAGVRHRGRAGARTTLLVVDCIRGNLDPDESQRVIDDPHTTHILWPNSFRSQRRLSGDRAGGHDASCAHRPWLAHRRDPLPAGSSS
jgi:mannose-6-phosphate isomerase-like protein (cupin superfamily)